MRPPAALLVVATAACVLAAAAEAAAATTRRATAASSSARTSSSTTTTTTTTVPSPSARRATATVKPAVRKSSGEIARRKCKEYEKYATAPEDDSSLVEQASLCVVPGEHLIVGGSPVQLNEFPHMALLGHGEEDTISYFCGGSLISPDFVLTAAHCINLKDPLSRWVLLGELDHSTDTDGASPQLISISKEIPHPDYDARMAYNDIGLLRLAHAARLDGGDVRPACLWTSRAVGGYRQATATGWGAVEFLGDASSELLKVTLPLQPHGLCNETITDKVRLPRGILDDTQLCAGNLEEEKDTCQGDSGGPLQVFTAEDCMHHVIGVTSFGHACAFKVPAVYTRVSAYVPWIEGIVWPDG